MFPSYHTFTSTIRTRLSEAWADTASTDISISPRATGLIGNSAEADTWLPNVSFWAFTTLISPLFAKTNSKASLCANSRMTYGDRQMGAQLSKQTQREIHMASLFLLEDTDQSQSNLCRIFHTAFLHTSMSCSKWLMRFTSSTISSPLMRYDGTSRDKEKSLDTLSCVWECVNQLKSKRALLIVWGSVHNVLPPLSLLLPHILLLHVRWGCISLKDKLCFMNIPIHVYRYLDFFIYFAMLHRRFLEFKSVLQVKCKTKYTFNVSVQPG